MMSSGLFSHAVLCRDGLNSYMDRLEDLEGELDGIEEITGSILDTVHTLQHDGDYIIKLLEDRVRSLKFKCYKYNPTQWSENLDYCDETVKLARITAVIKHLLK